MQYNSDLNAELCNYAFYAKNTKENNVTQQTIVNCSRHCGFVNVGMIEQDELVLDDIVEVYNAIPGNEELSFQEFVHFYNNTVVAGNLTNEEILAEVNEDGSFKDIVNNDNRN